MIKIYHNPRCSKSRAGVEYLKEKNLDFEVVLYLKNPLTKEDLERLLVKLNKNPLDMVRTQEEYFKKELKGKNFSDHEWIQIILENPKLLKRPIVELDKKAVWGVPVSEIDKII